MHTITLTGYRRPQLFRDTLASLAANDLTGWQIAIRVEPSPDAAAFAEIAASVLGGHPHCVTVNQTRLGVRENPFRAIDGAFAGGSTLNLCLEEDLVLAPDATALAAWFGRNHRPDWLCLCLLAGPCGTTGPLSNRSHPGALFTAKTFNSLGFAVRAQEWRQYFRPVWFRDQFDLMPPGLARPPHGWDWSIYARVASDPALVTVQPVLARANHTGREGGENCVPAFHDRAFAALPLAQAATRFDLVAPESLPHEARAHIHAFEELTAAHRALAPRGRFRRLRAAWRK